MGRRAAGRSSRSRAAAGVAYRVLVSARPGAPSRTSVSGASWISRANLQHRAAPVRMNGGAAAARSPVPRSRLRRARWYGCACIKWIYRGALADHARRRRRCASSRRARIRTRARRWARDFTPAVIDTAACRCTWEVAESRPRRLSRMTGIVWGGSKPTGALSIRFRSGQRGLRWTTCPGAGVDADVERVVTHMATEAPGRYRSSSRRRPDHPHATARCVFLCERVESTRCDPPGRSDTWAVGSWG